MPFISGTKVTTLGKPFMIKIGSHMSDMIRDETVNKGQDVRGHKFKELSDQPQDPYFFTIGKGASRKVVPVESYKSKKARGGFRRQSEISERANLQLTGDMMQDLQVRRATKTKVWIGWSQHESLKVQGNADNGREITTRRKPVSDTVLASAMNRINRQIQLNIKKHASNKKLTIKLGK